MRLGNIGKIILFLVFLLFSASVLFGQAGKNIRYSFGGDSSKCELIAGARTLVISYSVAGMELSEAKSDSGTFYRVFIPDHLSTAVPGKPELPVLTRLIEVPQGSGYHVRITNIESKRINPSAKRMKGLVYPAQESESKLQDRPRKAFSIDRRVYSVNGIIPSDTIKIERIGISRGRNMASLQISPVHYNPKSNVLEVITSMQVEISFSAGGAAASKSSFTQASGLVKSADKSQMDYDPADVITGYSTAPLRMVILTDTIFRKQLQPFVRWKTQKGFNMKVLYKGAAFAGTTYAQFKDTLTRMYNAGTAEDPPPQYLLIIGDVNRIPKADETSNISDMYYGEFDGDGDYVPEMFVGRLPVTDTAEARTVVGKILQYEKFEFADTNKFYNRALITAGNDATYAVNMNGQLSYALSNYLNSAGNISEYHFLYPQSAYATVEDSIKKIFRKGVSFVNYTGHGDATGWLDPAIKYKDVDSLRNRNMYPVIISNACRTAQYNTPASLGNKMVLTKDKGAVGFIGCSNDSYWDEDFFWAVGAGAVSAGPTYQNTGLGAYDRLFHRNGELPSDWYYTLGQINFAGNMAVSASTSSRKKYYWETYNVIGDPSLTPIIGPPGTYTFSIPDTLPNGMKSLTMTATPFAYIALSRADSLWDASHVSASGTVELKLPGISNDSCLMVVTGQNMKPVIKTIRIAEIKGEYVSLAASSINDIQGNNNKKADFGETFYLSFTVANLGLEEASNLYAKISTTSGLVSIITDSIYIGTLAAKSSRIISDKLELKITGTLPDMGSVTVDLLLKDSKTQKTYKTDICIHSPDLDITNCVLNDTLEGNKNNIADPGETFYLVFKVLNEGSSNISGQFYVTSNSPDLSVIEPNVKSGDLRFGETSDIYVKVKLSESIATGSFINLTSMLDCTPYVLNKDFSFRVGRIRESFESRTFTVFPWVNNGTVPWVITPAGSYDGAVTARSGQVAHNGKTPLSMRAVWESDDSLVFYYKVSSELNYDNLVFNLNGAEVLRASGEVPWTRFSVPVKAGLNRMEWIYSKDQSVSNGSDAAWLDLIDFASSSGVWYIGRDLQVARIVSPAEKGKYGLEPVTLRLLNQGTGTIDGFNLAYRANDQATTVTQSFTTKIAPGSDSVTVTFSLRADLSRYGLYNFTVWAYGNSDDYLLNDTLSVQLINDRLTDSLGIYPVPFSDYLNLVIRSANDGDLDISVINNTGAVLYSFEKPVVTGMNNISLTGLKLPPGVYYIRVSGLTIEKTLKVVRTGN